ncbi:DUF4345 domain-containing protein [Muricauda sp. 334s03]|uniref:DUF4345 domain-containing protein n=1 Tax=Flagellimonas yonaguniensis TaxID=3031325 RepID=A0ABT5Y124_9FLAO|nr:DUF4345 domain-containing protein [[Muricauda] yonaguniensis]MDF0717151.1 DUF4345 domain-containing protein [[Muricauda] yonaguniensis]
MNRKNLQLIVSSIVSITVGSIYGIFPHVVFARITGFEIQSLELSNVFRAIMGLYIAFGFFFIVATRNPKYWVTATLLSILFTGGLAFGRVASTMIDGVSMIFTVALIIEFTIMFWGIGNLIKYDGSFMSNPQ